MAITAWLAERAGTVPWHMTTGDYELAVRTTQAHLPITGPVPETPWDPALAPAMKTMGVAVHEEAIRARLLGELGLADAAEQGHGQWPTRNPRPGRGEGRRPTGQQGHANAPRDRQ
jgi:hypothetical protein